MTDPKDKIIRTIHRAATARLGKLAGPLIRAPAAEKEAILAEMEFERWLQQCCRECL